MKNKSSRARSSMTGALIVAGAAVGCGSVASAALQEHTVLVELTRPPTSQDVTAAIEIGAATASIIPVLNAINSRIEDPTQLLALEDVERILDLGEEVNPLLSVFIDVSSRPTDEDLDFVRNLGAETVGALSTRNRIAADLPLDAVGALGSYSRFISVEVVPPTDPIVPQQ